MSLTAGLWLAAAVTLPLLSVKRAVWALAFYMLTFFAAPQLWWWGDELPDLRYALIAGVVLFGAVVLHWSAPTEGKVQRPTYIHAAALGMVVNATFVHFGLAGGSSISGRDYVELLKFVLLFFLILWALKDRSDFRIAMLAIALGAAYIGYEVTINERGDFNGARLEGVGAPGADSANSLASLLIVSLPLAGSLMIASPWWQKVVVVVGAPLALNVILLCNSRGAFLSLIGMGLTFVLISRGATRKKAIRTFALGAVTLYMLLGDPEILQRFATTFVGSEERDSSANSRLEFWKAGLAMLSDHPLGAGGGAFKYVYGERYLKEVTTLEDARSLHNGYLTIATSWGVQGLVLHLVFLGGALVAAYRTSERCRRGGHPDHGLIGICTIIALVGLLIASVFGSFLPNEWGFWAIAFLVRYSELYSPPQAQAIPEHVRTAA